MIGGKQCVAGTLALLASCLALAGCQHIRHGREDSAQPVAFRERSAGVTAKQAADVQIAYARTLENQGQLDEAMKVYQAALKRDASRSDALVRLAILHDKQGQFPESAEYYRKALEANPGDPEIFCDKGYSLYLQRRWAEAEIALRQAIALRPDFPRAHNNLGLILGHDGRPDDALAEFRRAGSNSTDSHLNLAFVMTMEQRWPEARKEYQLALADNPNSEPAKAGLQKVAQLAPRFKNLSAAPLPRTDRAVAPAGLSTATTRPAGTPTATRPSAVAKPSTLAKPVNTKGSSSSKAPKAERTTLLGRRKKKKAAKDQAERNAAVDGSRTSVSK
jgi:tetratricopeptide (TPR) repeat protein